MMEERVTKKGDGVVRRRKYRHYTIGERRRALRMLASGRTWKEVEGATGMTNTTIDKLIKRGESKEFLKQEILRLTEAVPDIITQTKEDIRIAGELTEYIAGRGENTTLLKDMGDILKYLQYVYGKQRDVLKAVNVYPSPLTSILFQTMNTQMVIPAEIAGALGVGLMEKINYIEGCNVKEDISEEGEEEEELISGEAVKRLTFLS